MAYISQTPPGKGAVLSELPFKARNTLTRLPEARSARAIHRLAIGPPLTGGFSTKATLCLAPPFWRL